VSLKQCPSCGSVIDKESIICEYCEFKQSVISIPKTTNSYLTPQTQQSQTQGNTQAQVQPKPGVNWVVFILLLIFLWPVAIIYLVSKS